MINWHLHTTFQLINKNKQFALVLAARHCKEIFILRNVDWFLLLDYLIAQKEIFMSRSID